MFEKYQALKERRENGEGGFTLIELLVVVVIIGILVAIAIPLYLNYRKGANDKSAESDVRNSVTALENYYGSNNSYPAAGANWATTAGVHKSDNTTLEYKPVGQGYAVCGKDSGGSTWWTYTSDSGKLTSTADDSACTTGS